MSKYTMTIEEYVQGLYIAEHPDYKVWDLINMDDETFYAYAQTIFPADYPVYADGVKDEFEKQFIDHFRFNEIGQETMGRFRHVLKAFLQEEMPYFREIYASRLSDLEDALKDSDYTVKETGTDTTQTDKTLKINDTDNYIGTKTDTGSNTGTVTEAITNNTTKTTTTDTTEELTNNLTDTRTDNLASTNDQTTTHEVNPINGGGLHATDADVIDGETTNTGTQTNAHTGTATTDKDGTVTEVTSGGDSTTTTNNLANKLTTEEFRGNTKNREDTGNETATETKNLTTKYEGFRGIDIPERTAKFRELIFNIDDLIFSAAKAYGLFMKIY